MGDARAYTQDGSYTKSASMRANTRVAYRDNNLNHANDIFHSAIAVDSYYVVSKWGEGPLFKHSVTYCPYVTESQYSFKNVEYWN